MIARLGVATFFGLGFSNMLAATRDPSLHPGAAQPVGSSLTRLMNVLQVAGALLAIPAGLASAWSIYHANFSVEARCQSLRGNIVSMLDKSADATTLRMLIGRDVKAFEESCGAVDPEAVAAFKTLLTRKPAAPAVAQSAAKPSAAPAVAKTADDKTAAARTEDNKAVGEPPAQRESSDAQWLGAVREALVRHPAEAQQVESSETAQVAPPVTTAPPVHVVAAPVVTPAAAPTPVAAVALTQADHPVPPALIPEAPPLEARGGYRLGALIAHVPLIRNMFGR